MGPRLPAKRNKMRFLLICRDKYPPFRNDVAELFGKEMIQKNHKINWVLTSQNSCKKSFIANYLNGFVFVAKQLKETSIFTKIINRIYTFQNDLKVFRINKILNPDIIQVKDKFLSVYFCLITAKLSSAKITFWLSYPYHLEALVLYKESIGLNKLLYLYKYLFIKFTLSFILSGTVNHVFVQSEHMKNQLMKDRKHDCKITAVPMGIPEKILYLNRKTLTNEEKNLNSKRIIYLGTLSRLRKLNFLIEVFSEVQKKYPNSQLVFIGGGNDKKDEENLWKKAKILGVESQMEITGFLPMEDAWSKIHSSDIGISIYPPTPILDCASPTKLLEYMALGIPVIANEHPGQSEVLRKSRGGFCVPYEKKSFVKAILYVFDNPYKSRKMGNMGKSFVTKHYSYKEIASKVEAIYLKLIIPQ